MVIASGQAIFKPGLNGVSYGVDPVFDRKAIGLVPTQREQLLLCLCLGLSAHQPPSPPARGPESDIDGRHPPLPRFVPVKRALAAATACRIGTSHRFCHEKLDVRVMDEAGTRRRRPELPSVGGLTEFAHR